MTVPHLELVSLAEFDPTLLVELRLFTADNPFGKRFYRSNTAYLRAGTARKVSAAQKKLGEKKLRLKIWSAYRPFAVQVEMFRAVGENGDWVSDPFRPIGKKTHVRAVAIDCTLVDEHGNELPMPTPYLDFEHGAERMKHSFTDLSAEVLANRKLLKDTMVEAGMEPYSGEWWHYQDTDWNQYPILRLEDDPELHQSLLAEEIWKAAGTLQQPE